MVNVCYTNATGVQKNKIAMNCMANFHEIILWHVIHNTI